MQCLFVLYDDQCGICTEARQWCEQQAQLVRLEFLPAHDAQAQALFPELCDAREELIAVDDEGAVYVGAHAWLTCLWALAEYREWSYRLATPVMLPFARAAFQLFSKNRVPISRILLNAPDDLLTRQFASYQPAMCEGGNYIRQYLE